jgi:hypothetical protein
MLPTLETTIGSRHVVVSLYGLALVLGMATGLVLAVRRVRPRRPPARVSPACTRRGRCYSSRLCPDCARTVPRVCPTKVGWV